MEAIHLLTLTTAFIIFAAIFRRRTSSHPGRNPTTIRISDASIARVALIDHADAFSNRPMPPFPTGRPITHSISSLPYGPRWRAVRSNLTTGILQRSRLGILATLKREAAETLVTNLSSHAGGDVVLRDFIHGAVFALVARQCFGDGIDERDMSSMLQTQKDFLESSFTKVRPQEVSSWLTRILRSWRQSPRRDGIFDRVDQVFIPPVVAARRRESQHGNDGGFRSHLDSLLELQVPNEDHEHTLRQLRDEEVAFLCWEFLGGGTLSALTCLEWMIAHLAVEPEIQNKLNREVADAQLKGTMAYDELTLPYLHAVVLESLRLHPPTPFAVRHMHIDDSIAAALGKSSVIIPPGGAAVSFVLGDIGRDGKVWMNPDEFIPERFMEGGEGKGVSLVPGPNKEIKMMPFGGGRRRCPGVVMGMSHIKCFLAELVYAFQWMSPADGGESDFVAVDGFRKMMKTPLRVRITPRSPT
ncbi:hypothetical protein HU200_067769 [Digitaria exilis]|uniref:Cytochrome P450 n=1 Tax=Digitaria exilis TaxID=1010633 RepID=A0A834ZZU5_9POAL|nr:hypothetical protein HU200_067769 [Digitaria exilis]CAB3486426.1 unnamed protein product [Digitaria exilis]